MHSIFTMGFFASLIGYVACLCTAFAVIVASIAHIFPAPPIPEVPGVEVGAQKKSNKARPSAQTVTRRLAERAASRQ